MLLCTSMPKIHFCLTFLKLHSLVENGRPPDPADWAVTDVVNYFRTVGFEEQANAFQEQVNLFAQSFFTFNFQLGRFQSRDHDRQILDISKTWVQISS